MKFSMIKTSAKALLPVCAALALLSPAAQAESTYGYSPTGATGVTAKASVIIKVNIPTLILLRVGTAGTTIDELTFTAAPTVNTTPTAATLSALTADTSNASSNWDGALPTFPAPATQALTAYAWTNSVGGGKLSMASVVDTALTGIGPDKITVSAAAGTGSMPSHPANTTTNANIGTFTPNALHTATWTYGVTAATLAAAAAGSYKQTTTYTATAL